MSDKAISLILYDANGNRVRFQTINNNGHRAFFINELWPDLPRNFTGLLQIQPQDTDTVVYGTALRFEWTDSGLQFTGMPMDNVYENRLLGWTTPPFLDFRSAIW